MFRDESFDIIVLQAGLLKMASSFILSTHNYFLFAIVEWILSDKNTTRQDTFQIQILKYLLPIKSLLICPLPLVRLACSYLTISGGED